MAQKNSSNKSNKANNELKAKPTKNARQTSGVKPKSSKPNTEKSGKNAGKNSTKQSGKTIVKLGAHSQQQLERMQTSASKTIDSDFQKKQNVNASAKTQGMVNIIKQSNQKQIQKQLNTSQNKTGFNLSYLEGDKSSERSEHVEGVLKSFGKPYIKATKNNATEIKSNVVGKKRDIKVITTKKVKWFAIVASILLVLSIVSNFGIYTYFKFKLNNPPITITKTIKIQIENSGSFFASVTAPRNILPTTKISQEVEIYSLILNSPIVVRSKPMFTSGDGKVIMPESEYVEGWTFCQDGYYYYNSLISSSEVVQSVKNVTIPENFEIEVNGKNLNVVTFVYETLPANREMVEKLWEKAQESWLEKVF